MPNFSIPNQINPGDTSDATKAMANWTQIVNDLNGSGAPGGGKVDATNTAAAFAKDVVEPAFSGWKTLRRWEAGGNGAASLSSLSGSYTLGRGELQSGLTPPGRYAEYVDPADYAAGSRSVKYRLRCVVRGNGTASGCTFAFALFPVSNYQGGSGDSHAVLGAKVTGSDVTVGATGVNSTATVSSAEFAAPVAADLLPTVAPSVATAANWAGSIQVFLEMRQV